MLIILTCGSSIGRCWLRQKDGFFGDRFRQAVPHASKGRDCSDPMNTANSLQGLFFSDHVVGRTPGYWKGHLCGLVWWGGLASTPETRKHPAGVLARSRCNGSRDGDGGVTALEKTGGMLNVWGPRGGRARGVQRGRRERERSGWEGRASGRHTAEKFLMAVNSGCFDFTAAPGVKQFAIVFSSLRCYNPLQPPDLRSESANTATLC